MIDVRTMNIKALCLVKSAERNTKIKYQRTLKSSII